MIRANGKWPSKYKLYENSVQDAPEDIILFDSIFKELLGYKPQSLREDFCGTHLLSCNWVKKSSKHTAVCHDIDHEPLEYGQKYHFSKLSIAQHYRHSSEL